MLPGQRAGLHSWAARPGGTQDTGAAGKTHSGQVQGLGCRVGKHLGCKNDGREKKCMGLDLKEEGV